MKKSTRREIARDTLRALEHGFYINKHGNSIDFKAHQDYAENNTKLFRPDELLELIKEHPDLEQKEQTTFVVNRLTTLNSVRQEFSTDPNLVCLNFASARNPGGGFLNGSQAQEESIARATGLYPCQLLAEDYYKSNRATRTCLYTDHIIYSPTVPILKDEDGTYLDDLYYSAIITAPAVNTGVVLRNEPHNIDQIEEVMYRRIDMVLRICQIYGHKTLILGAWGCGVFRNDPEVIARMFDTLLRGKYNNVFHKVVFSIYSRNERFILPFQNTFL